jgi:assimilatory nitrate reductase catalytic subunit
MVISRRPLSILGYEYQVKIKGENYWRYQLAGRAVIVDVQNWSREFLSITNDVSVELLEYQDLSAGNYRIAQIVDQQLQSTVFFARNGQLPKSNWLCTLFDKPELSSKERLALLSGFPPQGDEQTGRTICSCFSIGEQTILQAIKSGCLVSVSAIGERLGAGTGCGSCLPELKQLLKNVSTF